jgi:aryl-alcohol dehydrogenase-like predicted oxidoreductase
LDSSLERMGFESVDLIYSMPPPEDLNVSATVELMAELVSSGRARAWGIGNWPAGDLAEAIGAAHRLGLTGPCAAQLPYSLVRRDWVEDSAMSEALALGDVGLSPRPRWPAAP